MGCGPDEFGSTLLPSVYQVARQLKKERNSLFNCVCSILDDAVFTEEMRSLYPGVPVLANLRCGLWYTQQPDDTCYFKSTDGHMGNWSFNLSRLNLHMLQHCVHAGAVMIVDATRNPYKGGFPDALTKTIPIWAAVMNRAIARLKSMNSSNDSSNGSSHLNSNGIHISRVAGAGSVEECGEAQAGAWDVHVHLPLWISSNEVQQVEARLDGWVEQLLATNLQQLQALAQALRKPLRPLWLSQDSRIWVDQVAQPSELPFTPLYLLTASRPVLHLRRPCPLLRPAEAPAEQAPAAAELQLSQQESQQQAWTYMYVPGAGDDEESWAAGLTPALLWQHKQGLMEAGAAGIHSLVKQLVAAAASRSSNNSNSAAQLLPQQHRPHTRVATDAHHLSPLGCRDRQAGQEGGEVEVRHVGGGAYALHGTPLLLGGWEAGAPPGVWSRADAVLYCGHQPHAGMEVFAAAGRSSQPTPGTAGETQQQQQGAACAQSGLTRTAAMGVAAPATSQDAAAWGHKPLGGTTSSTCDDAAGTAAAASHTPSCVEGNSSSHGAAQDENFAFAVAAALDLGIPPPAAPPSPPQGAAPTAAGAAQACQFVWQAPPDGPDQQQQQLRPPQRARTSRRRCALPPCPMRTAFSAPDVQASDCPEAGLGNGSGPVLQPSMHSESCSSTVDLELASVASLNAKAGIPAAQPSGLLELSSTGLPVGPCTSTSRQGSGAQAEAGSEPCREPAPAGCGDSVSSLQHSGSPCSCGGVGAASDTAPCSAACTLAVAPTAAAGASSTFEFAPGQVVDLTPADYISVPLQLDSRELAQMKAELRAQQAEQDAMDAAAAATSAAARQCWGSWLHAAGEANEPCGEVWGAQLGCRSRRRASRRTSALSAAVQSSLLAAQQQQLQQQQQLRQEQQQQEQQGCGQEVDGEAAGSKAAGSQAAADAAMQPGRYCWLPVAGAKQRGGGAGDSQTLEQQLQPALQFVLRHVRAGHTVLIHDDEGLDQCVCVAVAVLLALQHPPSSEQAGVEDGCMARAVAPHVTKASVRYTLAQLAASYPQARPTRGLLKQVFGYYHSLATRAGE